MAALADKVPHCGGQGSTPMQVGLGTPSWAVVLPAGHPGHSAPGARNGLMYVI